MSDDQFTVDGIFHARLTSKRESKSGIFLTIQLTPDDFSPALAQLRAGSLLKMGWQELLNVEVEPIEVENSYGGGAPLAGTTVPRPQANEAGISKPKKRFEDYPLSAQCAMRCEDAEFSKFIMIKFGTMNMSPTEFVRDYCHVDSRSAIVAGRFTGDRWLELEAIYQNYLTDQRHAESIRR